MDPLTITSAVVAISARCIHTAKAIYGLREKYTGAQMTITAIYTESIVISASLGHIQTLASKDPQALQSTFQSQPQLLQTLDQALTGCILVFSVLDDEVQKLYHGVDSVAGRARYVWKEQAMVDLLQQIRGQQTAMALLLQALQMSSVSEIKSLLQRNNVILEQVTQRTLKLRQAHPKISTPPSVLEAALDDAASIYSYNSTATDTTFIFDNDIINSQAYRRALAAPRTNLSSAAAATDEKADETSETDTVVNASQFPDGSEELIPRSFRHKLTAAEIAVLIRKHEETKLKFAGHNKEEFEQVTREVQELKRKYMLVKKYYFDKESQVQFLQAEMETLRKHKTEAEKLREENDALNATMEEIRQQNNLLHSQLDELETTKAFLLKSITHLEALSNGHEQFRDNIELARTTQREKYEQLIDTKTSKINELENRLEKEHRDALQLTAQLAAEAARVQELVAKVESLEGAHYLDIAKMRTHEEHISQLERECASKEEEIKQYRRFDGIMEQLKALSPTQPSSRPRSPLKSQHLNADINSIAAGDGSKTSEAPDSQSFVGLEPVRGPRRVVT